MQSSSEGKGPQQGSAVLSEVRGGAGSADVRPMVLAGGSSHVFAARRWSFGSVWANWGPALQQETLLWGVTCFGWYSRAHVDLCW